MSVFTGTMTLQCVGCKLTRTITAQQAAEITDQPCCASCGMPEIVVSATAKRSPALEPGGPARALKLEQEKYPERQADDTSNKGSR